jgi:hypothetical protein
MKKSAMLFLALSFAAIGVNAQAPANAPAGATGICKDGTYSTAAEKSGACNGHKGVQTWYAAHPTTAPSPANPAATPAPAPVASTPVASTAASTATKKLSPAQAAAARPAAPGGGKGLVWVNTSSNVYHCSDDPFYGKTKAGAYMSESDAKAKGAHGERGASCAGK